jgi:hypothetical protein
MLLLLLRRQHRQLGAPAVPHKVHAPPPLPPIAVAAAAAAAAFLERRDARRRDTAQRASRRHVRHVKAGRGVVRGDREAPRCQVIEQALVLGRTDGES